MPFNVYLRTQHEDSTIPPLTKAPWAPFQSRIDFDVADFALQARLNKNLTTILLGLIKRITKGERTSFKGYKDVCDAWEVASHISTAVSDSILITYLRNAHVFP